MDFMIIASSSNTQYMVNFIKVIESTEYSHMRKKSESVGLNGWQYLDEINKTDAFDLGAAGS